MWILSFVRVTFFSFLLFSVAQADDAAKKPNQEDNEKYFIAEEGELERLGTAARQHGWRVEQDDSGNLLLFPQTSSVIKPQKTIEPIKSKVNQKIDLTDLDALQRVITERGWGTERDHQGNLLLYPPELAGNEASKTLPTSQAEEIQSPVKEQSPRGDLDVLEKMLQARGWSTSRNTDGNLLLFPVKAEKQTQPPHPKKQAKGLNILVGHCEYGETHLNLGNKVSLPINRWAEARAISLAWLTHSEKAGKIGKIRKVNRLYITSIVADKAPYTLLNQLIIHSTDGRIISIP